MKESHVLNTSMEVGSTYVKLLGGMGNQMFQFAFGIAAAKKSNSRLFLDLIACADGGAPGTTTKRYFALGCFPIQNYCDVISSPSEIPNNVKEVIEEGFNFQKKYFSHVDDVRFSGYWQSPKYFESIPRKELLEIFSFQISRGEILRTASNIEKENSVCIHVRRGDMVKDKRTADCHGSCSLEYFQESIRLLAKELNNPTFFVFSDDPDWCIGNNLLNGFSGMVVSNSLNSFTDAEEMYLMSRCKHFIISNSSFSWWAAYLSENYDKKVIAPEPWFSDLSLDSSDLIPENWRKLCRNPGPLAKEPIPEISIVIPCYKQVKFLPSVLASVVAQKFPEWEAIIVDDGSPDETASVARNLIESYPGRRIKLLQKPNGGLADARNAGISESRGKYILPLDADDKIHAEMLLKTRFLLETNPSIRIAYTDVKKFGAENTLVKASDYNFRSLLLQNQLNCCSLYRKEAWVAVGGYNTNMVEGYEDWDFWIGCGEKGFYGKRIPEALFHYRVKESSMYTTALRHHDRLRARIILNHPSSYDAQSQQWAKVQLADLTHKKTEDLGVNINEFHSSKKTCEKPTVSVVIPCYMQGVYLKDAVESVIQQTFKDFEIVIVDDGSPDDTSLVAQGLISQHSSFRIRLVQKNNGGLSDARNAGISFANGKYILPLDADDLIAPNFLEKTVSVLEHSSTDVAIAYVDWVYFGEMQGRRDALEWDLQTLITKENLFTCTSLYRKVVWEMVGGYNTNMTKGVEDWDFWIGAAERGFKGVRIPEPLFFYRAKNQSMITDLQKYLPVMFSRIVLNHPSLYHEDLVRKSKIAFANAKLPEAKPSSIGQEWFLDHSQNSALPEFPKEEIEEIKNLVTVWQSDSSNAEIGIALKALRRGVTEFLTNIDDLNLVKLFGGSFGNVYRILLGSEISSSVADASERALEESLKSCIQKEGAFSLSCLAASMLFRPAHHGQAFLAIEALSNWFRKDFWNYTLSVPQVLTEPEEALKYSNHLRTWLREAVRRIEKEPKSPVTKEIASTLMQYLNVIPCYCTAEGNGELMTLRARVIEFTLGNSGLKLDMPFQLKGQRRAGQKIRVGVLNSHFGMQTETFVTLPALHLDKDRFEVHLFCGVKNPGLVEDRCRSLVKGFHLLPESIQERVQMIRNAKLDVLIIGTNITAVTNQIALLAAFRMAPIQIVAHCSPMTSGFKNSDAFLSGSLAYREGVSEAEFSEKLILLDGPPVCLDYSCEPAAPGLVPPDRSQLGIPADAVVFFNAASCYKIPLELLHLWARLLKEVPNSVLCLLPFNPNWASKLPETRFRSLLESVLAEHGVDKKRVLIGPKLPNRAAVMNFERIADVYLDTLPFSGSISTVDPLQLGIPVVACDGETTRSRCSGAQLRELGLDELVGQNEEEYFAEALHLARDQEYRSGISSRIKQAMSKRPRFLNPEEYGRNLGNALEVLVEEGLGALDDPKAFAQKVRDRSLNSSGDSGSEAALSQMTLSDAQAAFAEGRLSDAEDICREILGKDERCAGAWHLMGKLAALQGDLETAGEFATVACELDPQNAEFVRELAEVFLRKKELEPAEQQVRRALEMAPDSPDGLVLLGRILAEKDDKSASLEAFQDALRLRKDYAEGFSHYATALQKFARGKDAISQIRKACALEPDSVEFQTNLAILLEQNARYVDALAAYGKAARMNPNVGFVWFRQGKLLNGLKRYAESIPVLEKAISLPGQLGDYHYEYGLALHMSKRFQEALVHYEKALSMGYETAALHCNRGVIYKDLRKGGDSIMAFHKAVTMDPSNVSYLNNLGAAALELGLNSEALDCFEQAVEKNPKLPTARNNIGNLLKDRARGMDALPQYRKSMELNPDDRDAPSNYLLCHMYIPDMDPKLVFEEHKKWGISTTKKFPPAFKFKPREAGAKIRVGFLSADLCHHPVAHFIEPIFRGYDRERFEFVAYGDQRKSDEFSARFAKQVDLWRETSSYDDRALAKLIHEDRVDILFELAGHTAYNRLGVFALKPAPVQVSYLGYPGTTGLPTIDFRITDAFADPQGTTEHLHTEKLIRVPECAWCFEPDTSAPEVEPLPALKNGFVTFGCFNNMAKLNPALFETWAEILLRVPGSHLRLKARTLTDDGVRKELKSYFTERGIEEERLDFFGHTKKIADHLNHYHSVDIALDSFPYHGTTTTCEAMWMGCPVVTRAGKTHVSRVGVSLLSAVGLQEFITDTREAYIEKAVALAGQTERLQELRAGMRERMRQSVLMDEKRFVQGFEKALMEMAALGGLMRS